MPIILPSSAPERLLGERLELANATVLTPEQALSQDIRPARIGLLNLMPAAVMEDTEVQWLRFMSDSVLQIEPVFMKFDDDMREQAGASRQEILRWYTPFSAVATEGLDGLIVTGDNLELTPAQTSKPALLPLGEIRYAQQLREVIDWAQETVPSTIYSCLASHFLLDHLYGLERNLQEKKIFGVYPHTVNHDSTSRLISGLDDIIFAPHSRWGDIATEQVASVVEIEVLAVNEDAGWLLAERDNNAGGQDILVQGHPEYGRFDLANEYYRDQTDGQRDVPENYFPNDDASEVPVLSWTSDARALHANWIRQIYTRYSSTSSQER